MIAWAEYRDGVTLILGGLFAGCGRPYAHLIALMITLGAILAGLGWIGLMQ